MNKFFPPVTRYQRNGVDAKSVFFNRLMDDEKIIDWNVIDFMEDDDK